MDDATVEYLCRIADDCYQAALSYDKLGEIDLATAHLEVAMSVLKEIATFRSLALVMAHREAHR